MSQLQAQLEKLVLRIDRMGMRVEQALTDALQAIRDEDVEAGAALEYADSAIDRDEVEIEQQCVRLLALYQPAATDLRTICTLIKVNSDLERIANLAAGIGKQVRQVVANQLGLHDYPEFQRLALDAQDLLGKTIRMLGLTDAEAAQTIIENNYVVNADYRRFLHSILDSDDPALSNAEVTVTLISIGQSLGRIGDLCTNIAEDIIFLRTGDIVRHGRAFGAETV